MLLGIVLDMNFLIAVFVSLNTVIHCDVYPLQLMKWFHVSSSFLEHDGQTKLVYVDACRFFNVVPIGSERVNSLAAKVYRTCFFILLHLNPRRLLNIIHE